MVAGDQALLDLLRRLQRLGYRFTAITPHSHARVLARPAQGPPTVRDIFGWSRSFAKADIDRDCLALLEDAGALEHRDGRMRSAVRVASLGDDLFLHSAFPTTQADAVFFGPDTYRFARWLQQEVPRLDPPRVIVDMGAGSGAGGIVAARLMPGARIQLVDVNPSALRLAGINAAAAGVAVELVESGEVPSSADLVVANPPYMIDLGRRAYRDGGGHWGGEVALGWARQALGALAPGGTMLLYTGAAVIGGRVPLVDALEQACADRNAGLRVDEIDPDVFGDELDGAAYRAVERIAVIGATISVAR